MKVKSLTCALAVCLASLACAAAVAGEKAKIDRATAEKTALARVPNGRVKEAELENEHGKLVWSFDIAQPTSPDITEVQVDAMTGDVVAVEKETPKEQAEEVAKEKKEKQHN